MKKSSQYSFFEKNGYLFLPKLILDPEHLRVNVPSERGKISYYRNKSFDHDPVEYQVPGSLCRYNIPIYKQLHFLVRKEIERELEIDLHPTYFYDRFYFVNQELKRHTDRPACEISVTLQISSNNPKNPWPIWFQRPDGSECSITMNDGDAVVYKGIEREHWRNPLKSKYNKTQKIWRRIKKLEDDTYHHQLFLHYVNANGPHVHYAFDAIK